jgi:hypothetical protein
MREMPYGQWVAFDGADSVHECGQISDYDSVTTSGSYGYKPNPPPRAPSRHVEKASEPSRDTLTPASQKKGLPGWLDSLLAFLLLIFILWLFSLFSKK